MNAFENELKEIPRCAPSASLDARVERSLRHDAPVFLRPVPAWACALAAVIGVATGIAASRLATRDGAAAIPGAVFAANANTAASSFPFVNRSFVQP